MSDVWNIRMQLGAWGATVALPKSQFETAQEAINAAAKSVIDLAEIPDMIPMSKESMLAKRRELYKDSHRFSGMPTLEYDEILEQIECQIIDIKPCSPKPARLAVVKSWATPATTTPQESMCLKMACASTNWRTANDILMVRVLDHVPHVHAAGVHGLA